MCMGGGGGSPPPPPAPPPPGPTFTSADEVARLHQLHASILPYDPSATKIDTSKDATKIDSGSGSTT